MFDSKKSLLSLWISSSFEDLKVIQAKTGLISCKYPALNIGFETVMCKVDGLISITIISAISV